MGRAPSGGLGAKSQKLNIVSFFESDCCIKMGEAAFISGSCCPIYRGRQGFNITIGLSNEALSAFAAI